MSNQWLRLWHDMPNDPKWRTVARLSGEPISLVQAVYLHMLVDASQNVTRGHTAVTDEDLASALDCDESQIQRVREAMQGRVLDGDYLSGWEGRQPKREDTGNPQTGAKSAAQRKREQRERERQERESKNGHETSRNVTTDKDTDKDNYYSSPAREENSSIPETPTDADPEIHRDGNLCRQLRAIGIDASPNVLHHSDWVTILAKRTDEQIIEFARSVLARDPSKRITLKYLAPGLLEDPKPKPRASPARRQPPMSVVERVRAANPLPGDNPAGNGHIIDIGGNA